MNGLKQRRRVCLAWVGWLAAGALAGCAGPVGPTAGTADDGAGPVSAGALDGKADSAAPTATVLGAVPDDTGTAFGVWAPNADAVSVMGDFDNWDDGADPLVRDAGGIFSGHVAGARPGQQYLYVIQHGGERLMRADPRSREVISSAGSSVIVEPSRYRWQADEYRTPTWDDMVIYEMHLGTFADEPGGQPGTFASATEHLDDLAQLGVDVLELMPPAEFAGDFSWGYNTAFPFAPESAYGTPEDAMRFIDEAHARGIAVIVDVVHNHYGPSDLDTWCFDGECYGNGNGGIYFYTDWRRDTGWGPRPDFGRPEVRDFIVDSALMWLRDYRADGLRWDSTVNIRSANGADIPDGWGLLQRVNDAVDATQPWKLMIAEDLQGNDGITRPTASGGAGFDAQWDAAFFHPIDRNIIAPDDGSRSMWEVRDAITHRFGDRALARVIYTESHDEVANGNSRIPEMIWPGHADSYYSKKRSTLGAAIVFTAPGIPMIFQGQEMLEDGWFQDTVPLDWTRAQTFAGIRLLYHDLIHLRRNLDGNTRGLQGEHVNVFHVNDGDKVIAFHRWDQGGPGDDVVVVANFSNRAFPSYEIGFPRGGTWHVRLNSDWQGYDPDFGGTDSFDVEAGPGPRDGLGYRANVAIGPYTVVILSQ